MFFFVQCAVCLNKATNNKPEIKHKVQERIVFGDECNLWSIWLLLELDWCLLARSFAFKKHALNNVDGKCGLTSLAL